MWNFYSNDFEIVLTILLVNIFMLIFYNYLKSLGNLNLTIYKIKLNVLNKNNWLGENNKPNDDTKAVDLDFILQICNNKNTYNNIYDFNLSIKKKNLDNNYLNLTNTMKSLSGATSYEKLKFVNLIPFEIKEYHLKIKLTKEEFNLLKKYPLYLKYKTKGKKKKLKIYMQKK